MKKTARMPAGNGVWPGVKNGGHVVFCNRGGGGRR